MSEVDKSIIREPLDYVRDLLEIPSWALDTHGKQALYGSIQGLLQPEIYDLDWAVQSDENESFDAYSAYYKGIKVGHTYQLGHISVAILDNLFKIRQINELDDPGPCLLDPDPLVREYAKLLLSTNEE